MIYTITSGTTLIATMPIAATGNRRAAEQAAVAEILRHLFGCRYRLDHDSDGAPRLIATGPAIAPAPQISISHSRKTAVVAVDKAPIGIDIEAWRMSLENVRSRFLNTDEDAACLTPTQLLRAWTVKEAVYKVARIPFLALNEITHRGDTARAAGHTYSLATMDIAGETLTLARLLCQQPGQLDQTL